MVAVSPRTRGSPVDGNDAMSESFIDVDVNFKDKQRLVSFGHSKWGFKNWSWSITKQELDFVDCWNGKFIAGVATFVSVTIDALGLRREGVGYATTVKAQKGSAIFTARKSSVTNALRETLLSFGDSIASELLEHIEPLQNEKQTDKRRYSNVSAEISSQHLPNNSFADHKNTTVLMGQCHRTDSNDSSVSVENNNVKPVLSPQKFSNQSQVIKNGTDKSHNQLLNQGPRVPTQHQTMIEMRSFPTNQVAPKLGFIANHSAPKIVNPVNSPVPPPPLIAPRSVRPAAGPPSLAATRHSPNVSYLVQHVIPPLYSVQCGLPHTRPPSLYHNTYFTEFPPWPLYENFERNNKKHLNVNMPPKNFTLNAQSVIDCQRTCGGRSPPTNSSEDTLIRNNNYISHPFNLNGASIKPTLFYDGFWTEQQVKKWVAEQMDKPSVVEEVRVSNLDAQKQMCHSKV